MLISFLAPHTLSKHLPVSSNHHYQHTIICIEHAQPANHIMGKFLAQLSGEDFSQLCFQKLELKEFFYQYANKIRDAILYDTIVSLC